MSRKCETPLVGSGASRNSRGGSFQDALTLSTLRAQHLIGSHGISPEMAATIAVLAFGGGAHV
jgi:hypothetical protein